MVVGESSKSAAKVDLALIPEDEIMERSPRHQWSMESPGSNLPCPDPMMLYRDAFKSSSATQLSTPPELDGEIKDLELSSSSSTATLTNGCESSPVAETAINNVSEESATTKDSCGDQLCEKISAAYVQSYRSVVHSPSDKDWALRRRQNLTPYPVSVSPNETSSSISVASDEYESESSSSMESKLSFQDQEKSINSISDSATSSGVLSAGSISVSSWNLTSGLIHTAYSRLKDRDMLYRKRIKELEKEVKKVPVLKIKLAALKEENELLLLQLKYCSGKTKVKGIGDDSPYGDLACGSSNFEYKISNENCQSSGLFGKSSDSSGVFGAPSSNVQLCEKNRCCAPVKKAVFRETNCVMSFNKMVPSQRETSKPKQVSPEMTNKHETALLNDTNKDPEIEEETIPQTTSCVKPDVPKLSNLSACFRSTDQVHGSIQPKFCVKCPRCSFRISDESLQTNMRKDQVVQTDPHVFTFDRSTQTLHEGMVKTSPFDCFIQNLEKAFCESAVGNSENRVADQISTILQYIACAISDETKRTGSASVITPSTYQFENSCSSDSEMTADYSKAESAAINTVKKICSDLTVKADTCEIGDPCIDKTQKEQNEMKTYSSNTAKIDVSEIQSSENNKVKNVNSVELGLTTVSQEVMYSSCKNVLMEDQSIGLKLLPVVTASTSSNEERGITAIVQSERSVSSSEASDFADCEMESVSTEGNRNEMVAENGPKKTYYCHGPDCHKPSVCSFKPVRSRSDSKYKRQRFRCQNEMTLSSEDSSYHSLERKERCQSPSFESDPSVNCERIPNIAKEPNAVSKENVEDDGSQIFEVNSIEELVFPDEIKSALEKINVLINSEDNFDPESIREHVDLVSKHWFDTILSSRGSPMLLQQYLSVLSQYSTSLLKFVINLDDSSVNSIYHYLVCKKLFHMLDVLLQTGLCDVDKKNQGGTTPVIMGSTHTSLNDFERKVMKKLLLMSSDLNAKLYQGGTTALSLAASHGAEEMVELLLEAGADINAKDFDGSTALMYAAEHGFINIAQKLVTHRDCDLDAKDNDGKDACSIAVETKHLNIGLLIYVHVFNICGGRFCGGSGKCKRKYIRMSSRNFRLHNHISHSPRLENSS